MIQTTPTLKAGARLDSEERWLSYATSTDSGEIRVTTFPVLSAKKLVAAGREPVWSRNRHELFFRAAGKMWAVKFNPARPLEFEAPEFLFEDAYMKQGGPGNIQYDVAPNGEFLMIKEP